MKKFLMIISIIMVLSLVSCTEGMLPSLETDVTHLQTDTQASETTAPLPEETSFDTTDDISSDSDNNTEGSFEDPSETEETSYTSSSSETESESTEYNTTEAESESTAIDRSEAGSENITEGETLEKREALQVISIEMQNRYGDSTLIKYGNYEILVDAGTSSDKATVQNILAEYCEDGVLEMFIATHAHDDHIGSITSSSFFSDAEINTVEMIIDFGYKYTTNVYTQYASARDALIADGTTYYPITELFANEDIPEKFYLDDESVFIEFFDTGNYATPSTTPKSDAINGTSIAMCINYCDTQIFMAGDLTSSEETDLVSKIRSTYSNYFPKENTVIYKASHHASKESNSTAILDLLNPDTIWISSAIISKNRTSSGIIAEQHPYGEATDRMKLYTESIYWNGINGTTVFNVDEDDLTICGNGRTISYYEDGLLVDAEAEKNLTFLESAWYK